MAVPFGVLRVRNFRLLFVGQIVSNVGSWFQSLAQSLLILELTGSGKALGLITALQFLPMLALGPYAGTLADRIRPRTLMMITTALAALTTAMLAAVAATRNVEVVELYAVALVVGCTQAFARPASQAFLYELVGPADFSKAIGMHSVTQSSARMLGPAIGGIAYALLGSAACFAINSLSFACALGSLWLIRPAEFWPRPSDGSSPDVGVIESIRHAIGNPALRAPLLVNLLIGALAFHFMTSVTAMAQLALGGGARAVGAAHAINAAGAILGSLLIASLDRPPSRRGLAVACAGLALTTGGNALSPSIAGFLLWAPIFGLSVGAYQTSVLSSVQSAAEPGMLGRVSSLLALGSVGMMPIASLLAGWLIDAWSPRAAMALSSIACTIGALILVRSPRPRSAPTTSSCSSTRTSHG